MPVDKSVVRDSVQNCLDALVASNKALATNHMACRAANEKLAKAIERMHKSIPEGCSTEAKLANHASAVEEVWAEVKTARESCEKLQLQVQETQNEVMKATKALLDAMEKNLKA